MMRSTIRLIWATEDPNKRRQHQTHDPAHALMAPAPARSRQQANPGQKRQLECQLHDAGNKHAPGQRLDGFGKRRRRPDRRADEHRFSNTGVKAGTAKRPKVLSMPPANAVSEINNR